MKICRPSTTIRKGPCSRFNLYTVLFDRRSRRAASLTLIKHGDAVSGRHASWIYVESVSQGCFFISILSIIFRHDRPEPKARKAGALCRRTSPTPT
jgi:hypothetical protein